MTTTVAGTAIAQRVADVSRRMAEACERAGRDRASVTLIAVSKTRPVEDLLKAHAAGIHDFGENYVQEGAPKLLELRERAGAGITGHFIGGLQRNKVRAAIGAFDTIHSVDSGRLLEAIAGAASNRRIGVFIEVNFAGEASKGGIEPSQLGTLLTTARKLNGQLDLLGLMTVPPAGAPGETRRWFRQARELAREHGLSGLSMGMTGDFEAAIEEGATHIRVGQAIFGARL